MMRIGAGRWERLGQLFSRDGALTGARVLVGGVLGSVIELGLLPCLAVGAGLVGLTAIAHRSIEKQKQKLLTDTYRLEIASLLGKPPQDVTAEDLDMVAKPVEQGGKGIHAIHNAMKYFGHTRNFYIACQAVTAGLMIASLSILSAAGVPMLGLASGAALLYNELFNTVTNVGNVFSGKNLAGTITKDVRAITDQISLGGRISSTRAFGVFVHADPKLGADIKQRYGMEYDDLSIAQKREAVAACDAKYHIYDLTDDINAGRVLPTELAFLAYGQHSGVPRNSTARNPHYSSACQDFEDGATQQQMEESRTARFVRPPVRDARESAARSFEDRITTLGETSRSVH